MTTTPVVSELNDQQAARPAFALLRPIMEPLALMAAQREIAATIQKILTSGVDYGKVPGTGDKKDSLYKAGAERIMFAYDVVPQYKIVEEEIDHDRRVEWTKRKKKYNNAHRDDKSYTWEFEQGFSQGLYRYVVHCTLVRRSDGMIVGHGIGSASTMEAKYVNSPRDSENTILKMAKKRSMVDAVLTAFALSDRFTQDVEDLVDREAAEAAAAAEAQTTQGAQQATGQQASGQAATQTRQTRRRPAAAPDDWTEEEKQGAVGHARTLGWNGEQLRACIRGLVGHYPPKQGAEARSVISALAIEVETVVRAGTNQGGDGTTAATDGTSTAAAEPNADGSGTTVVAGEPEPTAAAEPTTEPAPPAAPPGAQS